MASNPVAFFASVCKSAMTAGKTVERRRASLPPGQPRAVQFRRAQSIASVHFIDSEAAPERHLSAESTMQYMESNVKERKKRSLVQTRSDIDPLLNRNIRLLPTPCRSSVAKVLGRPGLSPALGGPRACSPAELNIEITKNNTPSTMSPCSGISASSGRLVTIVSAGDESNVSLGTTTPTSSGLACTWKSGSIKSALIAEAAAGLEQPMSSGEEAASGYMVTSSLPIS